VSRTIPRGLSTAVLLCGLGGVAYPQSTAPGPEGFLGVEARTLSFERVAGVTRLSQIATPVGVVVPLGRFTLDIGTSWVTTRMTRADGARNDVDAFTDSQVRGSYVFGRDAVVATILLNLPTGLEQASVSDYLVVGAVSPSLLGFPVAAYASGFSVTSGVAAAIPAGDWSIGLAGSLRVNGRFTPYTDATGPVIYQPGIEGRVRGALDGLIGSSRLSLGFSYSTFGDDHFGKTTAVRGEYSPGPRWLGEAALLAPIGGSMLSVSLWHFRRSAGDTTGGSVRNRENLGAAELGLSIPMSRSVLFEPAFTGRISRPQAGKGRIAGVGAGFRILVSDAIIFLPSARYDRGVIEAESGARQDMSGGFFSGFIRVSF